MEMKLERKLRKVGDSLMIAVPAEIIKKLDYQEGQILEADIVNGELVLTKKKGEN